MNEAARSTYDEAKKLSPGYLQIPGKVVGGAAPQDCLAGKDCVGDERMATLTDANAKLAADASGVRAILSTEEQARGKPYTSEERKTRVAQLEITLASIGKSSDPLRQEGSRLIREGNVAGGQTKLNEALNADEKAIAEAERVAAERRKTAAQSARDLAILARGRDTLEAVNYYRRATRLDSTDAQTWRNLAAAAGDAGRTDEAKAAFEQAVQTARAGGDSWNEYGGIMGLGDVTLAQGDLTGALSYYKSGSQIADAASRAEPNNAEWQRDLAVVDERVGDVLVGQGNLADAHKSFKGQPRYKRPSR